MAARVAGPLCTPRLSSTTTSPGRSVGASACSTQARNEAVNADLKVPRSAEAKNSLTRRSVIGRSVIHGSVLRRPAAPFGPQPRNAPILVRVQVSSTKTSRRGSMGRCAPGAAASAPSVRPSHAARSRARRNWRRRRPRPGAPSPPGLTPIAGARGNRQLRCQTPWQRRPPPAPRRRSTDAGRRAPARHAYLRSLRLLRATSRRATRRGSWPGSSNRTPASRSHGLQVIPSRLSSASRARRGSQRLRTPPASPGQRTPSAARADGGSCGRRGRRGRSSRAARTRALWRAAR